MSQQFATPVSWRRCFQSGIVFLSLFAMIASVPRSFADDDDENWLDEVATLSGDFQEQQFLAGERVEIIDSRGTDDILVAGRDLLLSNVSAANIMAAGKSLTLETVEAGDLFLAGGGIDLAGTVKDDIVAAVCPVCPFGGRLHLSSDTEIGDDARLAGRDVDIDGRIGGDLYVAAKQFTLTGQIVGDTYVRAERIVLSSEARIGGDLRYAGPTEPAMSPGATVVGQVIQVDSDGPFPDGPPEDWIWYIVAVVLGLLFALVVLGAVMQLVAPGLLSGAAMTVVEQPWSSLGRGLVVVLLLPASVALLMVTIVGVPIGLVALAFFFVLLALAYVTISYCVGSYTRGMFGGKGIVGGWASRTLWTAIGSLILTMVGFIPFLGWAIGMLAMIAGVGAVIGRLGPILRRSDNAAGTVAQPA